MKNFIPWLVALLAVGGAFYFHSVEQKAAQTIAVLQPQVQELQTVREENEQLKSNQVSSNELERLRKDSTEALKLRNEIQSLRGEQAKLKQQAQAAQNQIQQAQAQAQVAQTQLSTLRPAAAAVAPPSLSPQELADRCLNNLRQIDAAKQQWALENKKNESDIPTPKELTVYFKETMFPSCPAGGQYTIGRVSDVPTCSIPGHSFPPQ